MQTEISFTIRHYDGSPADCQAFYDLNREWIEKYFKLEPIDLRALEDPEDKILKSGGHILIAETADGQIAGVCALLAENELQWELAKMAVLPRYQGKGIGFALGQAALAVARTYKIKEVMLLSNRILNPALHVYSKLGFKEVPLLPEETEYERADIKMVVRLS